MKVVKVHLQREILLIHLSSIYLLLYFGPNA